MNSQEVLSQIIKGRRSRFPRDYNGEPIDPEVLKEILDSANYAPNHKRTRPWRFQVFQGEEKIKMGERLAEVYKEITNPQVFLEKKYKDISNKWAQSDAVVSIVVNYSGLVPQWEEIAAVAMAVQNMYLTASAAGVGAYWSSPALKDHMGPELKMEENQYCLGFFFMGSLSKPETV